MTRLRTVIVDDEEPARELLRSMLASWPRIHVVAEAAAGEDAVRVIRQERPDLLFLDVQMPQLSGFDVVAALDPDALPMVVFVTAYDRYALRAFEVSACDYLLKPFDEGRLGTAVLRALDRHDRLDRAFGTALQSLLAEMRGTTGDQVVVKAEGRHIFLDADEIDWIEADGKELRLHLGKSVLAVRESMSSLERRLPPGRFLRVHRSTVINRSRLREAQPWFQGEYVLILRDGTRVMTGPSYRETVQLLTRGIRGPNGADDER